MQKEKLISIIKELNKEISSKFADYKGCYLYGSQSTGKANEDSDIDIVGLFDNINRDKQNDLYDIIFSFEDKYDIFLDFHPMTKEELERNYLYHNEVVNKGLYCEAA